MLTSVTLVTQVTFQKSRLFTRKYLLKIAFHSTFFYIHIFRKKQNLGQSVRTRNLLPRPRKSFNFSNCSSNWHRNKKKRKKKNESRKVVGEGNL